MVKSTEFINFAEDRPHFGKYKLQSMVDVKIKDEVLQKAAAEGMDAFVGAFVNAINDAIGGTLTAETMAELNADQITLLAWDILH